MLILVVNAGSSSLKYQPIDMNDESVLAKGNCDRIGIDGHLSHKAKGISILRESIEGSDLIAVARKLLDAVDYQGVCGLDFRREAGTGKAYFLECNPRFSGGLCSQIASGFDLPALL